MPEIKIELGTRIGVSLLNYRATLPAAASVAESSLRGERVNVLAVIKVRDGIKKIASAHTSDKDAKRLAKDLDRKIREAMIKVKKNPARAFSLKTQIKRGRASAAVKAAAKYSMAKEANKDAMKLAKKKRLAAINPETLRRSENLRASFESELPDLGSLNRYPRGCDIWESSYIMARAGGAGTKKAQELAWAAVRDAGYRVSSKGVWRMPSRRFNPGAQENPLKRVPKNASVPKARSIISENIAIEMKAGRPQKQAVAIALSSARRDAPRLMDSMYGRRQNTSKIKKNPEAKRLPIIKYAFFRANGKIGDKDVTVWGAAMRGSSGKGKGSLNVRNISWGPRGSVTHGAEKVIHYNLGHGSSVSSMLSQMKNNLKSIGFEGEIRDVAVRNPCVGLHVHSGEDLDKVLKAVMKKNPKTSKKIGKAVEKAAEEIEKAAKKTTKATKKVAKKTAKATKKVAKKTAKATKKVAKRTAKSAKAAVRTFKETWEENPGDQYSHALKGFTDSELEKELKGSNALLARAVKSSGKNSKGANDIRALRKRIYAEMKRRKTQNPLVRGRGASGRFGRHFTPTQDDIDLLIRHNLLNKIDDVEPDQLNRLISKLRRDERIRSGYILDDKLDTLTDRYRRARLSHLNLITSPSSTSGDIARAKRIMDDAENKLTMYAEARNMDPRELEVYMRHAESRRARRS